LNDYEQPLGGEEIIQAGTVFQAVLLSGPACPNLPPFLKTLTEEQLSQIATAAFVLYQRASRMKTEKTANRNRRNAVRGGKSSAESKERALAS